MDTFDRAMAGGKAPPGALRQAKLQMLQRRVRMGKTDVWLVHPFFRTPFIPLGVPAAGPGAR